MCDLPDPVGQTVPESSEASPSALLSVDLDESLDRIVDRVIRAALAIEKGNRVRAAERLGVSVRTIQRHLAREGIEAMP
jgi:DNA-binding NtrC family response regulator